MVSIIIPTYNRANTIMKSIDSVLKSTYTDYEIIIVDDCSTDNTEELLKPILTDKVRYIKNSKNKGIAATRNVGIANARGEFIAFNDSDDFWYSTKLEKQMKVMESHPECLLVYCAFERTYLDGRKIRVPSEDRTPEGYIYNDLLLNGNVISTQTMLFRKECFEKIGLFNTEVKTIDDYEMALKVAKNGYIGYVNEVLVEVIMSEDSVTDIQKNYKKQLNDYFYLLEQHFQEKNYIMFKCFSSTIIMLCAYLDEKEISDANRRIMSIKNSKKVKQMFCLRMIELNVKGKQKNNVMKMVCSEKSDLVYILLGYVQYIFIRVKRFLNNKISKEM